jgi:hypothetical protein
MLTFVNKKKPTQEAKSASSARLGQAISGQSSKISPILHLLRTIGNQAALQLLRDRTIQAKLQISQAGDEYEREADRVAEQVMRMPDTALAEPVTGDAPPQISRLQRKCDQCEEEEVQRQPMEEEEEEETLQAKEAPGQTPEIASGVRAQVEDLRGGGEPLPGPVRAFFEPRFGHDFSHVRVHTDENAETSAWTLNAHAYTVGNDIVFGRGRFDPTAMEGRRLLAHELTHVVQQSVGHAPRAVAREPADAEPDSPKVAPQAAPKPPKCHTGCAQRWGQDTTCSKWGFFQGVAERGEGKTWRSFDCCNSWPLSVEDYARTQLGLSGAASCTVRHEREIATVSFGGNEVEVLCSDTIPNSMFGEKTSASACSGSIANEVIEMSPKAMQDLSGQLENALHVKVCYSGSKVDLCLHNGPGARSFPTIHQCLTKGCTPWEGTPTTHKNSGWPRV